MAKSLYNIKGEVTEQEYNQVRQEIIKQKHIKPKYKLPTFDCPCCGAKRILFAGDNVSKNETILEMFKENGIADYVIVCPKCKQYIAVRRHAGKEDPGVCYRTVGCFVLTYITVYNNRIRGIYHSRPEHELIFEGEFASEECSREKIVPRGNTISYCYPKRNPYW